MRMLRRTATIAIAAALGGGTALGVAACGEDRGGGVTFEGGTGTETTGTATGGGTETTGTTATETAPETETETAP
jgi:hypothetical protein